MYARVKSKPVPISTTGSRSVDFSTWKLKLSYVRRYDATLCVYKARGVASAGVIEQDQHVSCESKHRNSISMAWHCMGDRIPIGYCNDAIGLLLNYCLDLRSAAPR
jgi:hypothetical protein